MAAIVDDTTSTRYRLYMWNALDHFWIYIKVKLALASYFEVALYIVVTFISYLPVENCATMRIAYALPPFHSSPKMTAVQTIGNRTLYCCHFHLIYSSCKLRNNVSCLCITTFWFVTKNDDITNNWYHLNRCHLQCLQTDCTYTFHFEPPMWTLQGIDHAPYIVGSVRNEAQHLLRWRSAFTRWVWHKT